MTNFKDEYKATLKDSLKVHQRFHRTLFHHDYIVALAGSTIGPSGVGKDIDVIITSKPEAKQSAEDVAQALLVHSKRLIYFNVIEYVESADVLMNFISHDNLFIDVFISGERAV